MERVQKEGSHSNITMSHNGMGTTTMPTFMLSPLNEYDEEFENPLNNAMIIERSATGFLWSKRRDEKSTSPLATTPLLSTVESGPCPTLHFSSSASTAKRNNNYHFNNSSQ